MMSKVVMVQGTMSNAGKSLVAAGLCRVFRQDGFRVMPFKSQNMALNSFITEEGLEMGRAQVMQAEAAGVKPTVLMNPVLLKPTSDMGSQVIVNGEVCGNMDARTYFQYKKSLLPDIARAFRELERNADIIVIEGAGSPAEINLKDNDIVNMGLAALVGAPVLLVGDIDRGGVFAQLLGTLMLLDDEERKRVKGLIINKFRGDRTILDPGIHMLEEKCGVPVTGVLPYTRLSIDDEDSLSGRLERHLPDGAAVRICVARLPHISNFSDFTVFEHIKGTEVDYISRPEEIEGADLVILPGSKNTIGDLKWLRESGLEAAIMRFAKTGPVLGICGGYQMLGRAIHDPDTVEEGGDVRGMGLLPAETVLRRAKTRTQVTGAIDSDVGGLFRCLAGRPIRGYEIHMGETRQEPGNAFSHIGAGQQAKPDGAWRGNVCGTYVHGIFDEGDIASRLADMLASRKGVTLTNPAESYQAFRESQYDRLADMIRANMDMKAVYAMLRPAAI